MLNVPKPAGPIGKKRRSKPGTPPGTLTKDPSADPTRIRLIAFGPAGVTDQEVTDPATLATTDPEAAVRWVNVDGLGDVETIQRLGRIFDLHPLAMEDVVNTHQRPKVEEYDDYLFVVTRMVGGPDDDGEQLAMFLGVNFVLTFQERPGDRFDPIRHRIRHGGGKMRAMGADYLAYTLLDAAVDGYFPVLEAFADTLDELEDRVLGNPEAAIVGELHDLKRELASLKRAIWPQREMFNKLIRDPSFLVGEQTRIYLRDCYDHTVQLMDLLEMHRETAFGLIDAYHSRVSTRLNEIMKVLTIIATIFIPLSFIASLYGMNFDPNVSEWNMPELEWAYGYPFALGLMLLLALALLVYFRHRGWIGSEGRRRHRKRPHRRR